MDCTSKSNEKERTMNKTKPAGKSKYAAKVASRKRAAAKVGLPSNATWPEIWAAQEAAAYRDRKAEK